MEYAKKLENGNGQWFESGKARGGEVAYMEASVRVWCVESPTDTKANDCMSNANGQEKRGH